MNRVYSATYFFNIEVVLLSEELFLLHGPYKQIWQSILKAFSINPKRSLRVVFMREVSMENPIFEMVHLYFSYFLRLHVAIL